MTCSANDNDAGTARTADTRRESMSLSDLNKWTGVLEAVATRPLAYAPDFPAIARRFEAWWHQDLLDRPILMGSANADPSRTVSRRLDLLDEPDAWIEAKLLDLQRTHRIGDTLPTVRADFGAVLLGGLLGGDRVAKADTAWTEHFLHDWAMAPDWSQIDGANRWWQRMRNLLTRAAQDAPGQFLVCTPDLGGSADVLITARGSTALAIDVLERPASVRAAVDEMHWSWRQAFVELYRCTVEHGAGVIHFFGLWSNRPYTLQACDFNALISPHHFQELFLPEIARQSATVGRAFFHLDGPDAARHIDALLSVPHLQAIQFTPGAGTPSALKWVPLFRKIQAAGKSVLVHALPEEVLALSEMLAPEGLAIAVEGATTPSVLNELFAAFAKRWDAT
jgi:hypothetical protein